MSDPDRKVIVVPGNEWREGVIKELDEMTEKLIRLRQFMITKEFFVLSEKQTELLCRQAGIIAEYADLLIERLRN